jgi:DDE superfamily endonuclease
LPLRPGQVERRTHDYTRHGTTTLFAALNTKSGKVISALHRRQRAREFRKFLDAIRARVPPTLNVHLILDNSSTHKTSAIHRWLVRHPRFHLHVTPTGSSWINLVERWFAVSAANYRTRDAEHAVLYRVIAEHLELEGGNENAAGKLAGGVKAAAGTPVTPSGSARSRCGGSWRGLPASCCRPPA